MHVFSVSAAMVGVCLTAIGILRLVAAQTKAQTLGDDLLAMDAVVFVVCTSLAFWSFKTPHLATRRRLRVVVDTLFLVGSRRWPASAPSSRMRWSRAVRSVPRPAFDGG